MTWAPIPWATQSTKAQSGVVSSEALVNCYLEVNPPNSKGPTAIYSDPGLKLWTTIAETPIRGVLLFKGVHLFVVAGNSLYVVTEDKTAANVGAIDGSGRVSMIANSTHVGIATTLGFYAATTSTVELVDGSYYTSAAYQDGYGVLTLADSEQLFITGIDDMTSINPLDFTSADTFADNLRACISNNRELIALGYETTEHFYNSGDSYFPFTRTQGGFLELGCSSSESVAKRSSRVFWLGDDGAVWSMAAYQPQRISTPGVENTIKELPNKVAESAFCYGMNGHEHYVLNFHHISLAYDITTGLWRERRSFGETRWRAQYHQRAWGIDLVTDFENGKIYELDTNTYDEDGDPLVRTMQTAPLHGAGRRVFMTQLYVDAAMGTTDDPSADPKFMLSWSADGGRTWSNERQGTAGKVGEYTKRSKWNRLGSFHQRTLRFSISDACKLAVIGAYADLETGV